MSNTVSESEQIIARLGDDFNFELEGQQSQILLEEDLTIDDLDLSSEFTKQPSLYAYYAILAAKADSVSRTAKLRLDEVRAREDSRIRMDFDQARIKSTEKKVEARLAVSEKVQEAERAVIEAKRMYAILKALENAFKMKADMLIRLGAMQRAELAQTDMNIKLQSPSERMKGAVDRS
jgi:hypothetical protein